MSKCRGSSRSTSRPAGSRSQRGIAREVALPDGRERVELAPTPPIPSYVVAFAVGPFDAIAAGASTSGVPIRVLVPHGLRGADHALEDGHVAARVLDELEAWTQIAYPFGKLDLVAVPRTGNFWAAMENPGLVTFSARFLDHREGRYAFLEVVAHELAHQWFGDLVTPAWWNDVWLNEGFATWLGMKISLRVDPVHDDASMRADDRRDDLVFARGAVRSPSAASPARSSRTTRPAAGPRCCACSRRTSARRVSSARCGRISSRTPAATRRPRTS